MLISLTLFLMGLITFFSVILGSTLTGATETTDIQNDLIVNGSTTTLEISGSHVFNIDAVVGAIAIIILITVIAGIIGIRILGSGLSDNSVKYITLGIVFSGIWTILSVLSWNLITSIEVFGGTIYVFLTIMYVIGVVRKFAGG